MQCISTVSYSFLINGASRGRVKPERGIRQGDPLSPYIFILCSEVFSGLCLRAQEIGNLKGIRVARGSPQVNHLLFADDTMFFCKTNKTSISALKKILKKYEQASGQHINTQKSAISFSRKTQLSIREEIKRELCISLDGGVGKYMGLPEHFGRRKKDLFTSIVDRIRKKAISWSSKLLSPAGKMVMLKSALSSMPSYAMSCFQLPISLCKRIQTALTRFWWYAKPGKRRMAWVAWDKLTVSKREGELGFWDIQCFNTAMLAKQSWKILTKPDTLVGRVLLGKYCHPSSVMTCQAPRNSSHGWRGVLCGRDLIRHHTGWTVGNGESIKVWSDHWLSTTSQVPPIGPPPESEQDILVKDLFKPGTTAWNTEKIQCYLPQWE